MIKLLATDLDGTLFYPKRRIRILTRRNRKFLQEFIADNRDVVLVSGRNIDMAQKISKKIKAPVDMVACNGSVLLQNDKVVYDSPMDKESIKNLLEKSRDDEQIISWYFMSNKYPLIIVPRGVPKFLKLCFDVVMFFQFAYKDAYIIGEKWLEKLFADEEAHIYKVSAICGVRKKSKDLARIKTIEYNDAYGTEFEVLWSNQAVEFTNKGVNKANALKKFINMLHLGMDEVAVIGDSGNDVSLFESFEHSFVMAHAPDEVKAKAKTEIKGVYCLKDYII